MKKASCPGHIFRMLCPGTLFSACPEACFPPVQGHEKFVCPGVQKCTMRILRNNLVIILWCIVLRIQRVHYHVIMICLFCGRGPVFIPSERQIRGSEVTSLLVVKGVCVCVCVESCVLCVCEHVCCEVKKTRVSYVLWLFSRMPLVWGVDGGQHMP